MLKKLLLFILVMVLPWVLSSQNNIIYGNAEGSGNKDGSNAANARELQNAFDVQTANDDVYVLADFYGGQTSNKTYNVNVSGTEANPVRVVGCDASGNPIVNNTPYYPIKPSDPIPSDGLTYPFFEGYRFATWDKPSNQCSGTGTANDYTGCGTGINLIGQWIIVENLVIQGYQTGINSAYPNNKILNCTTYNQGDRDIENSFDKCRADGGSLEDCLALGTNFNLQNYSGIGIIAFGANNTVRKCAVYNAGAEGIRVRANGNRVENSLVHSDDNINETDYHINISYNNSNPISDIIIDSCEVFVGINNTKSGHGYAQKFNVKNVIIRNSKATRTFFEMQFSGVSSNLIENCISVDGRVSFSNGANNNIVRNHTFLGSDSEGVVFENWIEGDDIAGFNNLIVDSDFLDGKTGIDFDSFSTAYDNGSVNNTFLRCNFKNLDALFSQDRENKNTKLIDCKIENVTTLVADAVFNSRCFPLDITFENCQFTNNGFSNPVSGVQDLNPCGSVSGQSTVQKLDYNRKPRGNRKLRN